MRWGPLPLGPVPLGPLVITRRSAELGLNGATLLITVIHSANLLLLTTPPEELVWALAWAIAPLGRLGAPVERLGFTLLLALRFLPLVQEEFQNLLRSLATRAVNLRRLGWKPSLALVLALGSGCWPTCCCGPNRGPNPCWPAAANGFRRPSCASRGPAPARCSWPVGSGCCCWWDCAGGTVPSDWWASLQTT